MGDDGNRQVNGRVNIATKPAVSGAGTAALAFADHPDSAARHQVLVPGDDWPHCACDDGMAVLTVDVQDGAMASDNPLGQVPATTAAATTMTRPG